MWVCEILFANCLHRRVAGQLSHFFLAISFLGTRRSLVARKWPPLGQIVCVWPINYSLHNDWDLANLHPKQRHLCIKAVLIGSAHGRVPPNYIIIIIDHLRAINRRLNQIAIICTAYARGTSRWQCPNFGDYYYSWVAAIDQGLVWHYNDLPLLH